MKSKAKARATQRWQFKIVYEVPALFSEKLLSFASTHSHTHFEMGCVKSSEAVENERIDKAQNKAYEQYAKSVKLLVLGTGDSGKTSKSLGLWSHCAVLTYACQLFVDRL